MKILQIIIDFFRRKNKKIKMIEAPKEDELEETSKEKMQEIKKTEDKMAYLKIENIPASQLPKEEKISQILQEIGCSKGTIESIKHIKNIDINNLRKNLQLLTEYKFTKLQLSCVIGGNWGLLYMDNDKLKESLKLLQNYIKDKSTEKEIIYRDSLLINEATEKQINKVKNVFDYFEIPFETQKEILRENAKIFELAEDRMKYSLALIKNYLKTQESFISEITIEPMIIGIDKLDLIRQYVDV